MKHMPRQNTQEIFSTSIYLANLLSPRARLLKVLKEDIFLLMKQDQEGLKWSKQAYPQGYTSYGSYDKLHLLTDSFAALAKALEKPVRQYIKALGWAFPLSSFYLSKLWVNVMPSGCYHAWHIHPLSVISGTFYLQAHAGHSPIRFEDPRLGLFMNRPPTKSKQDPSFFSVQPQTGQVILFESWLKHEVPMHFHKEPRISLSFNWDWK